MFLKKLNQNGDCSCSLSNRTACSWFSVPAEKGHPAGEQAELPLNTGCFVSHAIEGICQDLSLTVKCLTGEERAALEVAHWSAGFQTFLHRHLPSLRDAHFPQEDAWIARPGAPSQHEGRCSEQVKVTTKVKVTIVIPTRVREGPGLTKVL